MIKLDHLSKRAEIKYKVFYKDIHKLYSWISLQSTFKKTFGEREVSSLYFDTSNYDFAFSNMSGESKRIKIRARWYSPINSDFKDQFTNEQSFNVEMKRKINNFSDKINLGTIDASGKHSINERIDYLQSSLLRLLKSNILTLKGDVLSSVFINYKREYYEDTLRTGIRLTIDRDFSYGNSKPFSKLFLQSKNSLIVELKFNPQKRAIVEKLMHNFPFRQTRSSKFLYGLSQIKNVSY